MIVLNIEKLNILQIKFLTFFSINGGDIGKGQIPKLILSFTHSKP